MCPRMHHFQVDYQSHLVTWTDHFEDGCVRGGSMRRSDASENDAFIFVLLRYGACFWAHCALNVCLGMLVFLEPFLNGRLLFSRKEASRTRKNKSLEVSPCVIEVTSSVDFQIHPDEVEDDKEVMLISEFNVDEIKSYPWLLHGL